MLVKGIIQGLRGEIKILVSFPLIRMTPVVPRFVTHLGGGIVALTMESPVLGVPSASSGEPRQESTTQILGIGPMGEQDITPMSIVITPVVMEVTTTKPILPKGAIREQEEGTSRTRLRIVMMVHPLKRHKVEVLSHPEQYCPLLRRCLTLVTD